MRIFSFLFPKAPEKAPPKPLFHPPEELAVVTDSIDARIKLAEEQLSATQRAALVVTNFAVLLQGSNVISPSAGQTTQTGMSLIEVQRQQQTQTGEEQVDQQTDARNVQREASAAWKAGKR